ncbi:MAG: hypothetical protein IV100_03865 [Myxococcales bacterium]|nr:hypothetical protein [Myxococcales bacterium]
MKLQTFRAPTMSEAMTAVIAALGRDAVVVEAREPRSGCCEILAGVDLEPSPVQRGSASAMPSTSLGIGHGAPSAFQGPGSTAGSDRTTLLARLAAAGIDASVAEALVDAPRGATERDRARHVAESLQRAFSPAPAVWERLGRAVAAFVGPTGVGKTTTLAKVAAEASLLRGRRVGIVAADTQRPGAVEQVRMYADLLGLPWQTAHDGREVTSACERLQAAGRDLVLIDTGGSNPFSEETQVSLDRLLGGVRAERHLCMTASTSGGDMTAMAERYGDHGATSVIVTKLDEARSFGGIASLVLKTPLRIAHVTSGQNVPDDIERPSPAALVRAVLGLQS